MTNKIEISKNKLREISDKNENNRDGYSLGDVLLLDKFEKQLIEEYGFTKEQVERLSPSYYYNE